MSLYLHSFVNAAFKYNVHLSRRFNFGWQTWQIEKKYLIRIVQGVNWRNFDLNLWMHSFVNPTEFWKNYSVSRFLHKFSREQKILVFYTVRFFISRISRKICKAGFTWNQFQINLKCYSVKKRKQFSCDSVFRWNRF